MSIEINCKDQKVDDIMRDVKKKSESVIHGGWHVVIGKSNDPIMEFTNLDCLNEDKQYELLRNLDVEINQSHIHNSYCSNNPIFTANIFTMRRIGVLNSLYQQVLCEIKKNKNEGNNNKHVIIDCKDKDTVDILKYLSNVLYGEVSNYSPDIEFKKLDSLWIDELKELNKQLDGLYATIRNSISPLTTVDVSQKTWRLHRILDLQRQIIKELQRKENKAKKIEEEYSKMSTEELKNELETLNEWKNHYETNLNEYEPNVRVHPTWVKNFEHALYDTKSKIDMINKILAYRELKESSTNTATKRNEKWKRYNHLEVEELEMILDALNVRYNLYKLEDNECRAIKKAMDDILDNVKVIKDVLKCKRGE